MLRKRTLNQLEKLGLGHLAAREVTLYRYDGRVHGTIPCSPDRLYSVTYDPEGPVETFTSSLEGLAEKSCHCVKKSAELPELWDALMIAEHLYTGSRIQVTEKNTLGGLNQVAQHLAHLEQLQRGFNWAMPSPAGAHPDVQAAINLARSRLDGEIEMLRRRIAEHAEKVLLPYGEAHHLATTSGFVLVEKLYRLYGRASTRTMLLEWCQLLWRGLDRPERRRHLNKVYGHLCIGGWNKPLDDKELAKAKKEVKDLLWLVEHLEDELERRLDTGRRILLTTPHERSTFGPSRNRLLTETYTVKGDGRTALLSIPEAALQCGIDLPILQKAVLPEDPILRETAIGLWDEDENSTLHDPGAAVAAAKKL